MTTPEWQRDPQNRPRSNDPRLNPREQQGQDSCMVVAAPVLVGIGLTIWRLLR